MAIMSLNVSGQASIVPGTLVFLPIGKISYVHKQIVIARFCSPVSSLVANFGRRSGFVIPFAINPPIEDLYSYLVNLEIQNVNC